MLVVNRQYFDQTAEHLPAALLGAIRCRRVQTEINFIPDLTSFCLTRPH